MKMTSRYGLALGLFGAGVLLGLLLTGMILWAYAETAYYGFPHMADAHLTSLRCPHFMTQDEHATIQATITNTTGHPATFGVISWVSVPLAWERQTEHKHLAAGETWHWSREIGPENRDLRHFIMASVYTFGGYPIPQRQGWCGVFVLPLRGLRGEIVLWLGAVLTLALLFAGGWQLRRVWQERRVSAAGRWAAGFFLFVTPLNLVLAWLGLWMLGVGALVAEALLLLIVGLSWLMHAP